MERNKLGITRTILFLMIWIMSCSNPTYRFVLDDDKLNEDFPEIFKEDHLQGLEHHHYSFAFYECSKSVNGVIENVLVNNINDCIDGEPIHGTQKLDVYVHPIEHKGQKTWDYHIYAYTQRWEDNKESDLFQGQIIMYRGISYENDTNVHCTKRYVYKPYKKSLKESDVNLCFNIDRSEGRLIVNKIIDYKSNKYGGSKPVEFEMTQFFEIFALPKV